MRLLPLIAVTACTLGAIEGVARWWMRPTGGVQDERVLVWASQARTVDSQGDHGVSSGAQAPSSFLLQPSTFTPLPEVVAKSVPILHCTTGAVARIDRGDEVTIHMGFFEWDGRDSATVLEAFKHSPEACMGYIGMQFLQRQPPRSYQVGGVTLRFEHTVFREPGGPKVHAFKGIWVSGADRLVGDGASSLDEQSRRIRWEAALKRFHPTHARVAQGAVRGIDNPDDAWRAFEDAMLADLKFVP